MSIEYKQAQRKAYLAAYRLAHKAEAATTGAAYRAAHKTEIAARQAAYHRGKGAIKNKLQAYRQSDEKYERENNIDYEHVIKLLEGCNNTCHYCMQAVKLEWIEPKDPMQFSVNRKDNLIGHIKGNCEITCWGCNHILG